MNVSPPDDELLLQAARFAVVRRHRVDRHGRPYSKDTIQHAGAVMILPRFEDGSVLLIRNYRPAVEETLIELPAGTLEPPEPPIETARRELREETGYGCEALELLLDFQMSPGIMNERMHLYLATGLTEGRQALELGEQIEPLRLSWSEAMQMVHSGAIRDAKTLVALLYCDRFGAI